MNRFERQFHFLARAKFNRERSPLLKPLIVSHELKLAEITARKRDASGRFISTHQTSKE